MLALGEVIKGNALVAEKARRMSFEGLIVLAAAAGALSYLGTYSIYAALARRRVLLQNTTTNM